MHYYFGSREGLLEAIVLRHMVDVSGRMDELVERLCVGREPSPEALRDAIAAMTIPLAEKLSTNEGVTFVQIMAEVYERRGGLADAQYSPASAIAKMWSAGHDGHERSAPRGADPADDQFSSSRRWASRARAFDGGSELPLDHDTFVINLIEMGTLGSLAELPDRALSSF